MVCFSYGVVMWEMLTGELPHKDLVDGTIMLKAMSGQLTLPIPESKPNVYKELLYGKLMLKTMNFGVFTHLSSQYSC